ncbi:hypothetical protein N7535_001606 [Penicillium sp. DV-2018c]|nr:hypothetical protein N7535_001606 [Penicillium sp. DV-2018c]
MHSGGFTVCHLNDLLQEDIVKRSPPLDFMPNHGVSLFQDALKALKDHDDCPETFLHCYTSEYLCLNEIATSHTESAHWLLKKDLYVSTNDLIVILQSFERALKERYAMVRHEIEAAKIRNPRSIRSMYRLLVGRISSKAIKLTEEIYSGYLPGADGKPQIPLECTCNSKETAGFPCIHTLKQYEEVKKVLSRPSSIHSGIYGARMHPHSILSCSYRIFTGCSAEEDHLEHATLPVAPSRMRNLHPIPSLKIHLPIEIHLASNMLLCGKAEVADGVRGRGRGTTTTEPNEATNTVGRGRVRGPETG